MALDNVTSHFSTMLEPITSASFLSSLSIIHNSLMATTFLKRPPPVGGHFKNNRFVSQSNTVSNTTSKLALFQISCYSHARYHKQFRTTKYYARMTLDPSQGVNYYEIKFSRLDKQGKSFSRLGAEISNCITLCIRKLPKQSFRKKINDCLLQILSDKRLS